MKKKLLSELELKCKSCKSKSCGLQSQHNKLVFDDGNPETAKIVLIGEAPGAKEVEEGKPFVGKAGQNLNEFLIAAGISRSDDLYIINTVKCRPPKNRKPQKAEKEACRAFLHAQIDIINPEIIILCGSTAMNEFLKGKKITDIHGNGYNIEVLGKTYKAIPILHPSPLCTYPNKKNVMVKDLLLAKSLI